MRQNNDGVSVVTSYTVIPAAVARGSSMRRPVAVAGRSSVINCVVIRRQNFSE
jgi:hypothetical protein